MRACAQTLDHGPPSSPGANRGIGLAACRRLAQAWLATLPDDGPTDGFFRDRRPISW
jgi:hypothetical protein